MAGEEDTRPVKSPYAGRQAVLHFCREMEQSELRLPFNILEPHEELTRKRKREEAGTSDGPSREEFDLTDTPFSVGHVIVHFLLTGTYQSLRPWCFNPEYGRAQEFRTAVCVYGAAVDKKLPGLRDLARLQIAKLGEQINLLSIISVIEGGRPVSNSLLGTFNPGITEYLRFKVRSFVQNATEAEAKDMLAKLGTPNTIGKILLQSLMLMKISTELGPEEDTDPKIDNAPATKNSVQLAEEAIKEAEEVYERVHGESDRRFWKIMEEEKARMGMGEGYQEQSGAA